MVDVAGDLRDATVRHQIGLLRVSNATVRKTLALLARVEADILGQLRAVDPDSWNAARLETQLRTVRETYRQEFATITGTLRADLIDLAEYEARFTLSQMRKASGVAFNVPTKTAIAAAVNARPFQGRFLREWMAGLSATNARAVRDAVRMGFVEGESLDAIIRRIRGTKANNYRDGILEINRRAAERVVRTAITHTASRARDAAFEENKDALSGVQWVSVLDGRTSMVCAGRDGKTWPVGEGPRPPAHFNCRSQVVAVIEGFPPPERTTYPEWLRRQSTEMQNEALGPTRARLWRGGHVEITRFVDRKGEAWTLDELKRREGPL